jgi:hypothetical protein
MGRLAVGCRRRRAGPQGDHVGDFGKMARGTSGELDAGGEEEERWGDEGKEEKVLVILSVDFSVHWKEEHLQASGYVECTTRQMGECDMNEATYEWLVYTVLYDLRCKRIKLMTTSYMVSLLCMPSCHFSPVVGRNEGSSSVQEYANRTSSPHSLLCRQPWALRLFMLPLGGRARLRRWLGHFQPHRAPSSSFCAGTPHT